MNLNPMAVRRWHELVLDARFGDATDAELIAELLISVIVSIGH
ncbi:hypothetical protein [Oryzicola mucosus]|nr:hypothetical protein [Oryzicola mucosus]